MSSDFVNDLIKSNKVVVFSKTYCPFSAIAKQILKKHEPNVAVIELDKRNDGDEIFDYLEQLTGERKVPRVFIDSKFIGGSDRIQEMEKTGELNSLLQNTD